MKAKLLIIAGGILGLSLGYVIEKPNERAVHPKPDQNIYVRTGRYQLEEQHRNRVGRKGDSYSEKLHRHMCARRRSNQERKTA